MKDKKTLKQFEKNYGIRKDAGSEGGLSLASEAKPKDSKGLPTEFKLPCKESVAPAKS